MAGGPVGGIAVMSLQRCYRRDGGWRIAFAYDADVVEALKAAVPHVHRSWDGEAKEWWVAGEYEDVLLKLFPSFRAFLEQPQLF